MSETLDTPVGAAKRPTFLTVLCILTFVGSGLGILGGFLGLIGTSALGMFAPQGTIIVQIIGLAAALLCLFGAIKMWGLFKQGFLIYVLGSLLSIVGSVVSALSINSMIASTLSSVEEIDPEFNATLNSAATSLASSAAWTAVVTTVVINVLFILLYNANRKHLIK